MYAKSAKERIENIEIKIPVGKFNGAIAVYGKAHAINEGSCIDAPDEVISEPTMRTGIGSRGEGSI